MTDITFRQLITILTEIHECELQPQNQNDAFDFDDILMRFKNPKNDCGCVISFENIDDIVTEQYKANIRRRLSIKEEF